MTTEVTPTEVRVWFGWVPIYRRAVSISGIQSHAVVEYRPIADYGGWGIRAGRDGERVLNARGNRGVRLELADGSRLLIGSQRPEELAETIERARTAGCRLRRGLRLRSKFPPSQFKKKSLQTLLNRGKREQDARDDQARAGQGQRPDGFLEHEKAQDHRDHEAELVDRRHSGDRALLERGEVEKPGKPRGDPREYKGQPAATGDRIQVMKLARCRDDARRKDHHHDRPDQRGQIGRNLAHPDLGQHGREPRENRRQRGIENPVQAIDLLSRWALAILAQCARLPGERRDSVSFLALQRSH